MDESKAIELYNFFVKEGYDVNTQEVFINGLKNSDKASELYDFFSKEGYDVGEKKNFLLGDGSALASGTSDGFNLDEFLTPSEDQFAQPQAEQTFAAPQQDIVQGIAIDEVEQANAKAEEEKLANEEERLAFVKDESAPGFEKLQELLQKVDLTNKPEEKLVPELNYLFEGYGFKFEETGAGNAVKITAPNDQEKVISYGSLLELGDPTGLFLDKGVFPRLGEAMFGASEGYEEELRDFIKQNRVISQNAENAKKKLINEKEVKEYTNNFNNSAKEYLKKSKELENESLELAPKFSKEPETVEEWEFLSQAKKDFEAKQLELKDQYESLKTKAKEYDSVIGEYALMRTEQGGVFRQILDTAKGGIGMGLAFVTDLAVTGGAYVAGVSDKDLKEFKYGKEEKFVNPFSEKATKINRDSKKGFIESVEDLPFTTMGRLSTKEYREDRQQADLFSGKGLQNVMFGVAEFVPATMAAGIFGTISVSAQYVNKEMQDSPSFDEVSEMERLSVSLGIGVVVGVLENVGFKNVMQSKAFSGFTTAIATKALGRNPATMRTFNEYVEQEVKSLIAKGALKMGAGFTAEFETGAAQEAAEMGLKNLYNATKGSDLFDTPESIEEAFNQILMGGIAEGIGGSMMATPGALSSALKGNQLSEIDDATFAIFEEMSKDSEYLNIVSNKLDQQVVNQEITKEDRDRIFDDYNRLNGAMQNMPEGIKTSQKKQLLSLFMELQKVKDNMDSTDDAFNKGAKKQKEQIEKRIDALLKDNDIENTVDEVLNTEPSDTKVFYAEKLEDIPEQHRDNATLVENAEEEVTFNEKILGLPIGKEKNVAVGDYYTYTLNGTEIDQVVDNETEVESDTEVDTDDSAMDSLFAEVESKKKVEEKAEPLEFPAERKIVDVLGTQVSIDGKEGTLKEDGERIIFETVEVDPEAQKEIERLESSKRRTEQSEKMRGYDVSKAKLNKEYDEKIAKLKNKTIKRQVDLGNKNDIMLSPLSEIGAKQVALSAEEQTTFDGKEFNAPPIQTTKGEYISGKMTLIGSRVDKKGRRIVTVKDKNGLKKRFTGEAAEKIMKAFKNQEVETKGKGDYFSSRPPQGTSRASEQVSVIGGDSKLSNKKRAKYERIVNMATKAMDAISRVLPDLKILIHTNESTFVDEIGEVARGAFDPSTNIIHINLQQANFRTVGHEVLHAILVNRLKTDRNVAIAVNKMIDSVKKSVPKEVAAELEAFVKKYRGSMKNEEYIAELFGILSERYNSLPNRAKNAIRDFIRAVQDLFNLPKDATIRDQEVFDFITTMSRKVGQGEVVQEGDLALIEDIDKEIKAKTRKEDAAVRQQKGDSSESFEKSGINADKVEVIFRHTGDGSQAFYYQLGKPNSFSSVKMPSLFDGYIEPEKKEIYYSGKLLGENVLAFGMQNMGSSTTGEDSDIRGGGNLTISVQTPKDLPNNLVDKLNSILKDSIYKAAMNPDFKSIGVVNGVKAVIGKINESETKFLAETISSEIKNYDKSLTDKKDTPSIRQQKGDSSDAQFQLDTEVDTKDRKEELKEQAIQQMEEVLPERAETIEEISKKGIPVKVKENTKLADKLKKVGLDFLIGKTINLVMADQLKVSKKYMGGPFFPLIKNLFGKVAWASMNNTAASSIVNGAMKSDYSVVYNMSPKAIFSNTALRQEILSNLSPEQQNQLYDLIKNDKKFKTTAKSKSLLEKSNNLKEMFDLMGAKEMKFDVADKIKFFENLIPSQTVEATSPVFSFMQKNGLNLEQILPNVQEQFAGDLPMGALTMIVEVRTKETKTYNTKNDIPSEIKNDPSTKIKKTSDNKLEVTSDRRIKDVVSEIESDVKSGKINKKEGEKRKNEAKKNAILSKDQQKKEGLKSHPNYAIYIRGKAVSMLKETLPFWDIIKSYKEVVSKKIAGEIKDRDSYSVKYKGEDAKALVRVNEDGSRNIEVRVKGKNVKEFNISKNNKVKTETYIESNIGKIEKFKPGKTPSIKEAQSGAMGSAMKGASRKENVIKPLQSTYETFIDRLSKALPGIEVVTSQKEFDALMNNLYAKKLINKNQKVYGAVYNGKLYLNPSVRSFNTPIHEFGHIWTNTIKELNNELYNKGMSLVEKSEYVTQIKKSKQYKKITDQMKKEGASDADIKQYILEEALATAIGDKGESFANAAQERNFKGWLTDLFNFVKKLTGISELSANQVQELTLDQFLEGVVVDLLSDNELFKKAEVKNLSNQLQLMTSDSSAEKDAEISPSIRMQQGDSIQDIIKNALAKGISVKKIKDFLMKNKGYTQSEVDALFPKPKKKVKQTKTSLVKMIKAKAKNTKKGKVSLSVTNYLINQTEKLNYDNEAAVQAFVDKVAKIYDRAGTLEEITTAKKNRKGARKALKKAKLGASVRAFVDAANEILSIKIDFIPLELLEEYNEVMAPLAKRETVKIIDVDTLRMQELLTKIQEQLEEQAEAKAEKGPTRAEKNRASNIKLIKDRRRQIKNELSNKYENELADFLLSITDAQLEQMSSENIEVLNNLMSQIENGYLSSFLATKVKAEVDGEIEGGGSLLSKIKMKVAGKLYVNSMAKIYTKLTGLFSKDTDLLSIIRSTALSEIDSLMGNFNARDIYNKTFGKLESAKSKYDTELNLILSKIDKFNDLISGGKVFKVLSNKQLMSKFRIMASLLQDEFDSNPGAKGVASAIDYIDGTVAKLEEGNKLQRKEADLLLQLKEEIEKKGIVLSEKEQKAKKIIIGINNDITEKFMFVAAMRGENPTIYNSYMHHSAMYSLENQQEALETQTQNLMNPSTKAGTTNERTKNKAISFDPSYSTLAGVKQTLLDFHMTQPIKEVRASISVVKKSKDRQQRQAGIALEKAFKEALQIVLSHNLSYYGMAEKVIDNIRRLSYYATLASVPRAFAELLSNGSYALLGNPAAFARGAKYNYLNLSTNGAKFMDVTGSGLTNKNYSREALSGSRADSASFNRSLFDKSNPKGGIAEAAQFIAENSLVGPLLVKGTNFIAEKLISTPDKIIARPLWFGTFFGELKSLTGKKFTKKEILEMANGESKYLKQYKNEIEAARIKADKENVQMSGASNAFNSILKDQVRNTGEGSSTAMNTFRIINTYMGRFVKNEFNTVKSAIYALFNSGEISRPHAIALIAAVTTRMTAYMVLYTMFKDFFFSLFDDEEDKEKETDYAALAQRQLVGSLTTLMTRRYLGNIPSIPIALATEYINETELESLRNGEEYDPFKNSLIYSPVNISDIKNKDPYEMWLAAFGGPFGPSLKSFRRIQLVITKMNTSTKESTRERYKKEFYSRSLLELAGNFGLLPFYKDIRTATLNDLYKGIDKSSKKVTLTDAQKKKYMPDLYRREKEIEERIKSTDLYKRTQEKKAEIKKKEEEMLERIFGR